MPINFCKKCHFFHHKRGLLILGLCNLHLTLYLSLSKIFKMGIDEVKKYVIEKLKEVFLLLNNFSGQFLHWFDKVFPPETRKNKINHWFHVALPFLIATLVFALISYCCYCCCCRGRGRGRGRGRTMKAPGRNCRMPRSTFESNPRDYFQNLRAYPGDELV